MRFKVQNEDIQSTERGIMNYLLYANHGHHADQTRWKATVKGSKSLLASNADRAIDNALVGFVGRCSARLSYQTSFDGILKT